MSRQLEKKSEDRRAKFEQNVLRAIEGGLETAVERAGGELRGFSVKVDPWECLLTIRADFPGGAQVAFVGASGIGECLVKAMLEAGRDKLRWKEDKWRVNGG